MFYVFPSMQNKGLGFHLRVDFIIPNLETVGGFSMCSSPAYLDNTRMLDLAVKVSPHPPAQWVHKKVTYYLSFTRLSPF